MTTGYEREWETHLAKVRAATITINPGDDLAKIINEAVVRPTLRLPRAHWDWDLHRFVEDPPEEPVTSNGNGQTE